MWPGASCVTGRERAFQEEETAHVRARVPLAGVECPMAGNEVMVIGIGRSQVM